MDIKEKVLVVYPVSPDVNFSDYRDKIHPPTADITYLLDDFPARVDIKSVVGIHLRTGDERYHFRAWVEDSTGKRLNFKNESAVMNSGTVYFDIYRYKNSISYLMDITLKNVAIIDPGMYQIKVEIYPGSLNDNPDSERPIHRNSAFVFIVRNDEECEDENG